MESRLSIWKRTEKKWSGKEREGRYEFYEYG
jgi:hypothetical protein